MTKVEKKKQFVTHGEYTSIAKFLDKNVPRYRAEYLEYFCLISKIGINLRYDFSRKPLRRSAGTCLGEHCFKAWCPITTVRTGRFKSESSTLCHTVGSSTILRKMSVLSL